MFKLWGVRFGVCFILAMLSTACCKCPPPGAIPTAMDEVYVTPFRLTTNGKVYSIAKGSDGSVYAGGDFTTASLLSGFGLYVDDYLGYPDNMLYPPISGGVTANAGVWAVAPDGYGGWYIGGDFTYVGSVARKNLAHIDAYGELDPDWNPGADNTVVDMHMYNGLLYISGIFTSVGGETRKALASINNLGQVTTWNPLIRYVSGGTEYDPGVFLFDLVDGVIYAGGAFSSVNGETRGNVAAIDANSGAVQAWRVGVTGSVNSIKVSGNTVYIAGNYTDILSGGTVSTGISKLAAVGRSTGTVNTGWKPAPDGTVYDVEVINGVVFAGGGFANIGATPTSRNYLAALDATTAEVTSWNPGPNNTVNRLAANSNDLYIGGAFTMVGATTVAYAAKISGVYGSISNWNMGINNTAYAFGFDGYGVYVGGKFTTANQITVRGLAAVGDNGSFKTMPVLDDGLVRKLTLANDVLYVGGTFTSVGSVATQKAFALNLADSPATIMSWSPNITGTAVYSILVDGSTVYLGGWFTKLGAQTRTNIGAVDATSGAANTSWDPNADSFVYTLTLHNGLVYAGGFFSNIGGQARNRLAALDSTGKAIAGWNPNATGTVVSSIVFDNDTAYIGGVFTKMGSESRANLAAVDASGAVLAWNPGTDGEVGSLKLSGGKIYIGGGFTTVAGQSRRYIAELDTAGQLGALSLSIDKIVYTLLIDDYIYAGGDFTSIGGQTRGGIARINLSGGLQ